jgi:hypothetical protein
MHCSEGFPHVLLVRVGRRQGKASANKDGKAMRSGVLEYAAEERS